MAKDIQTEDLYTLYVHTNIENKKVYIGITGKDTEERWRDGEGYKYNPELYADIKKYGWELIDRSLVDWFNREVAASSQRFIFASKVDILVENNYSVRGDSTPSLVR